MVDHTAPGGEAQRELHKPQQNVQAGVTRAQQQNDSTMLSVTKTKMWLRALGSKGQLEFQAVQILRISLCRVHAAAL